MIGGEFKHRINQRILLQVLFGHELPTWIVQLDIFNCI